MIGLRPARPDDALAIAAVHVATWRSAYPGILPARYLARLSVTRQAAYYERMIQKGGPVLVAANPAPRQGQPPIVGFTTGNLRRHSLGEAEIETLYVLDDWREQGLGRGLLTTLAARLAASGARSAFCWVLRDNPSRWFYAHLGGRESGSAEVRVAGVVLPQIAYAWSPIARLLSTAGEQDGGTA